MVKQEGDSAGQLGHAKASLATKVQQTVQDLRNGSTKASDGKDEEASRAKPALEGMITLRSASKLQG